MTNILTAIGCGLIIAGLAFSSYDMYGRFLRASYRRQVEIGAVALILIAIVYAAVAQ